MEKYYHVKEEYLNILHELPELPSMPDIGEPDVILTDGEQWKSDIPLDGDLWRSARSERAPRIALFWGDLGVPAIRLRPISAPMAP